MRKTKRFTPDLLTRYEKLGRGLGTFENYLPWHRVGRSDPSSIGRSHLQIWNNRQREFLSDGEWVVFMFSAMLQNLVDIREQFPLQYEVGDHETNVYKVCCQKLFPGTRQISEMLGFKHPRVHGDGRTAPWVMTTDLLLTLFRADGSYFLLAIAHKTMDAHEKKRTQELLEIEKTYWEARGVEWLLITRNDYLQEVALSLRNSSPWALGLPVETTRLREVADNIQKFNGLPLTAALCAFAELFGDMDTAQRAFWQAVWSGEIYLDLRRGWRPYLPIRLTSAETFWQLNPIASRRSSWTP